MAAQDMRNWRGLKALVHDAIDASTDLVDLGHESAMRPLRRILAPAGPLGRSLHAVDSARRLVTRGVLGTIKGVNRAVEKASDAALDAAMLSADTAQPPRNVAADPAPAAALGWINAAVGDYLSERGNGLDLSMVFRLQSHGPGLDRQAGRPVARAKVALFVHGLGLTERSWWYQSEAYHGSPGVSFGSLLERDLGFLPVFVRYNTGRRISENGRLLASELEQFVRAYPIPIEDLTLVGHSMGGLVALSACHYGALARQSWTSLVRRVFCLASPHRGAPLAKLGHALTGVLGAVDLPATKIIARILDGRSAGIKDLRHGAMRDEDWLEPDIGATEGITWLARPHYFVSATFTENPDHPLGRLVGDLLVRVPSATGPTFEKSPLTIHTSRYGGVLHHHIQNHPSVYQLLRRASSGSPPPGQVDVAGGSGRPW